MQVALSLAVAPTHGEAGEAGSRETSSRSPGGQLEWSGVNK